MMLPSSTGTMLREKPAQLIGSLPPDNSIRPAYTGKKSHFHGWRGVLQDRPSCHVAQCATAPTDSGACEQAVFMDAKTLTQKRTGNENSLPAYCVIDAAWIDHLSAC